MQIFGAITAVGNFDILGHTVVSLTCASCDFDKTLVHRHLDDVPTVSPADSGNCEKFAKTYKEICEEINLKLADDCEKKRKSIYKCHRRKGSWHLVQLRRPHMEIASGEKRKDSTEHSCRFVFRICDAIGYANVNGKFE